MSHKRAGVPLGWYQLLVRIGKMRLIDVQKRTVKLQLNGETLGCKFVQDENYTYLETTNKKGLTWYQLWTRIGKTKLIEDTNNKVLISIDDSEFLYYCTIEFINQGTDAYINIITPTENDIISVEDVQGDKSTE